MIEKVFNIHQTIPSGVQVDLDQNSFPGFFNVGPNDLWIRIPEKDLSEMAYVLAYMAGEAYKAQEGGASNDGE